MARKDPNRLGSIRVEPETRLALDRLSATTGQSINEIVRVAIAAHLRAAERRRRGAGVSA